MKYWLLAIVAYTVAFCLSLVGLALRIRQKVVATHGLAMWKEWR